MDTNDLVKLLPSGYENACFETKAITRKRAIKNPLDLLWLILYYLSGNHSLMEVSQFASIRGIGKISDVAFLKKFIQCKEWIRWLIAHILPKPILHYKKPAWLEAYQVLTVDASRIVEKGAMKRIWRLHYAVDLFSLTCNQFQITEQSTGESLKNFEIHNHHLVITDHAYGTIESIEYCLKYEGNFIIRIKNKAFLLYDKSGKKWNLTNWLKTVGEQAEEQLVYFKDSKKTLIPIRICAAKKTKEEIAIEEKQITYSEDTKFTHHYLFVITSLPPIISAEEVLSCYRLRWQVDLVLKRLKSLLQLGNIPTKTKESGEVWINGKLLLSLLTENSLEDIDFSPAENNGTESKYLERSETVLH